MQLRMAGYVFSQIGGVFLVHYPHLNSPSRNEWDKKPKGLGHGPAGEAAKKNKNIDWGAFKRAQVDALFVDFKEWLDGTLEEEARVPMCQDALNDDIRLWVHTADQDATDDDDEEESADKTGSDDGEYFEEYGNFLDAEETYDTCQEKHSGDLAACFVAAKEFIKLSVLWSAVGAKADYLGAETHMEYLVAAEECAKRFSAFARDGAGGDRDNQGKDSFQSLLADLYASMGAVEQGRNANAKAASFARRALVQDPNWEAAQKILSELAKNEGKEKHEEEVLKDTESIGTKVTGKDSEERESSREVSNGSQE